MDVLIIPCPNCRHELRLPDHSLLGRFGRCPACRHKFVLEATGIGQDETSDFTLPPEGAAGGPIARGSEACETVAAGTGDSVPEGEEEIEIPRRIGRYEIRRRLGQGAMGAVYLAFDGQLHREVALKVPRFSDSDGKEPIERFYREARMAATLSHPSICPVYDIGEADGTRYIAMAYISGHPLSVYIRKDKRQPLRHIAKTICRVALAVQEAHDRGVVHRDLKPDNIMIDDAHRPVIMDFGLARRLFKLGDERLTHSGAVVGSPAYMSPEQIEGDPSLITGSSDIYSLGVVLYELMTGERPFTGYVGAVMGQILRDPPRPPSALRPDIDPLMESICLKMMAKRAADRYASMDEVAHVLAAYLRGPEFDPQQPLPTIDLKTIPPGSLGKFAPAPPVRPPAKMPDDSAAEATCDVARKLIDGHHYDRAAKLLRKIPKSDRDPHARELLARALNARSQVKSLVADVNSARRHRDLEGMCRKLERLLELKPDHKQGQKWLQELRQRGLSGIVGGRNDDRRTAEWILDRGGTLGLLIDGGPILKVGTAAQLPAGDVRVISAMLNGCSACGDDALVRLAELSALQNLSLAQTSISDEGLAHLAALTGLTSLALGRTTLTGAGLKHFGGLTRLLKLDLSETPLGDAALALLDPLESLEFLGLLGTNVSDSSARHLAQFTGLAFLDLYDTRFSGAGIAQLSKSLPACRINY